MPVSSQLELDFTARPGAEALTPDNAPKTVAGVGISAEAKEKSKPAIGEPLGIRMVNEFVYCPRLFYYEVVEGLFVHNPDTLEGAEAHKRVDTAKPGMLDAGDTAKAELPPTKRSKKKSDAAKETNAGNPPGGAEGSEKEASAAAAQEAETIHARSVSLYSAVLNVTAKLDLVEGQALPSTAEAEAGGAVRFIYTPVEYKKGRPREGDEGRELWDADRVQLMLQILLLRENGFPSEEGIVFYRETRQRVTFQPTDEDAAWARRMVAQAHTSKCAPMPPPLDHSPKCPRCSLASICLPDETRLLGSSEPPLHSVPHEQQLEFALIVDAPPEPPRPESSALIDYVTQMPAPGIRRVKADPEMRRLIAPNPETRTLYLNTPGARVGKSGETITVKEKEQLIGEYLVKDLHHVALFGPVQISTQVVQMLCEEEIPLTYFSTGGWFYGVTRGHTLKNVLTRIEQFRASRDPASSLALARTMIYGKIVNQRTLLMRNHLEPPKSVLHGLKYLAHAALLAPSLAQLLGVEGNAAGLYFGAFGGMLKAKPTAPNQQRETEAEFSGESPDNRTAPPPAERALTEHRSASEAGRIPLFPFFPDSRNRRPPRDPINALLSLTYAMLVKECTIACYAVGLDPYVGFLHQPRHGRPALALDIMEEFRPLLADSAVLTLINNGMLTERDFILSSHAAGLTPGGRKVVINAWERRLADGVTHPLFGYKVSYRRAVELQVRILAKYLTGEIAEYVPFMTR